MEYPDIPQSFETAESFGFLPVPIPVPPMIEDAFKYDRHNRYVSLGFGVRGGVMSDFVGDSCQPRSRNLYRSFLTHPAIRSCTDAFHLETEPPRWLEGLQIEDCEGHEEQFETWSQTSRCLLLDRDVRQFFVGTIAEIRQWLILRPVLGGSARSGVLNTRRAISFKDPELGLADWLAAQSSPALSKEFIAEWERRFDTRQSVSACVGAASRLGFGRDAVHRLMAEVFPYRGSE
jgi:hypothetical protein